MVKARERRAPYGLCPTRPLYVETSNGLRKTLFPLHDRGYREESAQARLWRAMANDLPQLARSAAVRRASGLELKAAVWNCERNRSTADLWRLGDRPLVMPGS